MADVADAFDAALNLEEAHLDEGWEDGLRCVPRGRGRALRLFSAERGARARRSIDAFGEMLGTFPIHDPLNEEILEILNAVRGKFKTIVSLMGMHKEYAQVGDAPAGMGF